MAEAHKSGIVLVAHQEPKFTRGAADGISFGLNKGAKIAKIAKKTNAALEKKKIVSRVGRRKGRTSQRVKVIREVIREVAGMMPYEKRCIDVLKLGLGNPDKKVYKICKKRLGTHRRAMYKRDDIKKLYAAMRAKK